MPIYEYKCLDCSEVSEILLRSANNESIECPICGSKNLERLLSAPMLVRMSSSVPGRTCCGRTERCDTPPCSSEGVCRRD